MKETCNKELLTKNHLYVISLILCLCFSFVIYYEYFIPRGSYILCKTNNNIWLAGIRNDRVSEEIGINGFWEKEITDFLVKNVKPTETIIEIGANIGYYTTLLSKLIGSKGQLFSYEANKEVCDLAELSLKFNGLDNNVTLKNIAVLDHSGKVSFISESVSDVKFSTINIGEGHIKRDFENDLDEFSVPCISLDEDLPNLKNVDWLRMDIKGSEILAIKGAKRVIENSPNLKIVMEWDVNLLRNYGNVEELIDYLYSCGFKFYQISVSGSVDLSHAMSKEDLLNASPTDVFLSRNPLALH